MARQTIQKLPQNPERSGSTRRPGLQAENETTPRSRAFAVENFEFVIPDVSQPVGPAALGVGITDKRFVGGARGEGDFDQAPRPALE
jgi:hypothetical protein